MSASERDVLAMSVEELRAHLTVRNERRLEVQHCFDAFRARSEAHPGIGATVLEHRCPHGEGGHHPVLAKCYVADEGLLFRSRIVWQPQDGVTTPPWMIDQVLNRAAADFDLADDDAVQRTADMVHRMRGHQLQTGRRPAHHWLNAGNTSHVDDVLDLPPDLTDPWLPTLWIRCPDHPGQAGHLDTADRREWVAAARNPSGHPPRRLPRPPVATGYHNYP